MGCKRRNMSNAKRQTLTGRGAVAKIAVIGATDRAANRVSARPIAGTDKRTLQHFVGERAAPGAKVYTDEHDSYQGMPFYRQAVNHGVGEYV